MAVPGLRCGRVADYAQAYSAEKRRIEGRPHPYGSLPVTGIGGALVKEPSRSEVPGVKEGVATGQELRDLPRGEARCFLRCRRCS